MSGFIQKSTSFLFEIFIVDPTTGLGKTGLSSGFTSAVFLNGTYQSSPPTVTITEMSSSHAPGVYKITMTPNAVGRWYFFITHSTYGGAGWNDYVMVYNNDLDTIIGNMILEPLANWESNGSFNLHSVGMALAILCNKVAVASNTETVYKTDGTTPLQTFTLAFDASQNPIKSTTPS